MTEPGWARSIAISKASRSDSRCAAGSMMASSQCRLVSLQFSEKCLIVEITPSAWIPLIDSATSTALSSGSSEMYSKLRPLRGSRARLIPPASITLNPRLRASRPTIPPDSRASAGLKLAPSAMPAGSAVAVSPSRYPGLVTPRLASLMSSAGTPSRGTPGTYPALIGVPSGMRSSRTVIRSLDSHDADEQREPLVIGHPVFGRPGSLISVARHGRSTIMQSSVVELPSGQIVSTSA